MDAPLLQVRDLQTHFATRSGTVKAVDGVSFDIARRTTVGLVGESGCGKSILAQSLLQIQPWPGRLIAGSVLLHDDAGPPPRDLAQLPPKSEDLRRVRGNAIAYIHQEPMAGLSLLHTVGNQMREAVLSHHPRIKKAEAHARAVDALTRVGIPGAAERMDAYIFNLSGGMRQRVMIAMALINDPQLLIADEPTTAVDVTIQAQVLELLADMQRRTGMSIVVITHNLGIIAEIADEVMVMYLGKIVERGPVMAIFDEPRHPYTRALIDAMPTGTHERGKLANIRGSVPDPYQRPAGCPFHNRCPDAIPGRCDQSMPALVEVAPGHTSRCFLHSDQREGDIDAAESRQTV